MDPSYNVFISWSGTRARRLGEAMKLFISDVIQAANPWISSEDIDQGRRWNTEVATLLEQTRIGIIILPPENLDARWILFEAGALAKTRDDAYVCPYLLNVKKSQVASPLSDFQLTTASRDETLKLMRT